MVSLCSKRKMRMVGQSAADLVGLNMRILHRDVVFATTTALNMGPLDASLSNDNATILQVVFLAPDGKRFGHAVGLTGAGVSYYVTMSG